MNLINVLVIVLAVDVGILLGVIIARWAWREPRTCRTCKQPLHRIYKNWSRTPTLIHTTANPECWRYIKERNTQ